MFKHAEECMGAEVTHGTADEIQKDVPKEDKHVKMHYPQAANYKLSLFFGLKFQNNCMLCNQSVTS